MYVCVCNAIRECDFRRAARCVPGDAEAVYASLGKTPRCRQCLEEANEILAAERQPSSELALVA
jgi:bacterioferritin-associated ferredoxin